MSGLHDQTNGQGPIPSPPWHEYPGGLQLIDFISLSRKKRGEARNLCHGKRLARALQPSAVWRRTGVDTHARRGEGGILACSFADDGPGFAPGDGEPGRPNVPHARVNQMNVARQIADWLVGQGISHGMELSSR